jgi:hypothetical protein
VSGSCYFPRVTLRCARLPSCVMRIATWNVNSLKARLEKATWWLERADRQRRVIPSTVLQSGANHNTSRH